jgi:thiosulfate/3-mercaptopyruvate sulfurtransferase
MVQRSWIKILSVLLGLILIITALGGFVSGCKKAEEKKETKKEQKENSTKAEKVEFKDPDLLVNTNWLEDHLSDKDVQIIDVRAEGEYNGGHIEGAVNLPITKTVNANSPIQGMVAPEAQFESLLSELGISNDSHLVVYDGGGTPFAGRVFWILKYYGQKKVSVLDGGIKEWQKEGKKLKFDAPEITKTTYKAKANPVINATKDQIQKLVEEKDSDVVMVDTRPQKEWDTGHLPGAVRLDWVELSTADDPPVFKSAEELQKLFNDAGITKDKDVVLY